MNLARTLVDFSISNKRPILLFWIMVLILSGWGATKLSVSADNRVFYSEDNVAYNTLRSLEDRYLPNHNISFLATISNNDSDSLSQLVQSVRWLSERAWEIENVIRVDSIDNYPIATDSTDDSFSIGTIAEAVCATEAGCENIEYLEQPPQGIDRRLISEDRRSLAVSLSLELEEKDTDQIHRISEAIETLESEFKFKFPEIALHYTGGIPMMYAFSKAADQDSIRLAPITLTLILGLTCILVGSVRAAFFLILAGASCALITLGIAGHLGHVINPATSIASIMIITLVVTSAMHFVSSYLNDTRLYDIYRSTINATSVNLRPIALATVTSLAGFLSLSFADAPPIGQLGTMAATGVLLGALHIFLLGPIFLRYLPNNQEPNLSQRISLLFSRAKLSRVQAVIIAGLLTFITTGVFTLTINDDFVGYFDSSFEFRVNTDYVSEHLSGPNHLEIELVTNDGDSIFSKAILREIDKLSHHLRSSSEVANVFSIVDVFKEIEPIFKISQFEASEDELAQFYLAFELSLRQGQSTTDYISSDQTGTRISVILGQSDSNSIRELIQNIETWSSNTLTSNITVTGENAPVASLTSSNFRSMAVGIAGTLILAGLLIAINLRSIRLALMCIGCTAAPIAIGFGLWGWIFGEIGLASVVVLAITIGIVIDDAIHIITRYQEIRRSGAMYSSAIEQTTRIAGGAIVASSIALASGFSVLALSGFGVNATMGLCTAIIVISALFVDLIMLPWALKTRDN